MVLQFRALENHSGIYVRDTVPGLGGERARVLEKPQAARALPARIRVREMHADVACGYGSENRVGDGMRKNVCVRVAFEAEFGRYRHSAEDQGSSGDDSMRIPALADANSGGHQRRAASCSKKRRARSISLGRVILILRSL